jgi:hypothetical protein
LPHARSVQSAHEKRANLAENFIFTPCA